MRKKIELVILLILITGLVILNKNLEEQVTSEEISVEENTVVIDAGHGGCRLCKMHFFMGKFA